MEKQTPLGQEIIRLRKERGWTKIEFKRRSGISIQTIYRLENGLTETMSYSTAVQISEAFGVELNHWKPFVSIVPAAK